MSLDNVFIIEFNPFVAIRNRKDFYTKKKKEKRNRKDLKKIRKGNK